VAAMAKSSMQRFPEETIIQAFQEEIISEHQPTKDETKQFHWRRMYPFLYEKWTKPNEHPFKILTLLKSKTDTLILLWFWHEKLPLSVFWSPQYISGIYNNVKTKSWTHWHYLAVKWLIYRRVSNFRK
jgi:hypothetical protein